MHSHTGAMVVLGKVCVYFISKHQKLIIKSSTKADMVGIINVLPQVLCNWYFLDAQFHDVRESVVCQDNKITKILDNNGSNIVAIWYGTLVLYIYS